VKKIGLVGGTGYTGIELLRLLVEHSEVELAAICSRSEAGQKVSHVYPNLSGVKALETLSFSEPSVDNLSHCDLVFFATPNGIAMNYAAELLAKNIKVIDLAADFRFKDLSLWRSWYDMEHACPELVSKAIYGLPEMNREHIRDADLVGSAGCYTTAAQLALLPMIDKAAHSVDWSRVIIDAKSGVSGAGKALNTGSLFSEASENFSAYGVSGHRHLPEICHSLKQHSDIEIGLTFTPHLVPMVRGILATCYLSLKDEMELSELQSIYESYYHEEAFVDVLPAKSVPSTKAVRSSNLCRIALHRPNAHTLVVLSVIDNLVKGASGQAVQNMNLMLSYEESCGLNALPLYP